MTRPTIANANCICLLCGRAFVTKTFYIKRGGGKYCSQDCYWKRNSKKVPVRYPYGYKSVHHLNVVACTWCDLIRIGFGRKIPLSSKTCSRQCAIASSRKHTLGTCEQCGKPNKTAYTRFCSMTCRSSGANNPNWKGGLKTQNRKLRDSPLYHAWRQSVFERDSYTCVWCGQVGGSLQADHIRPWSLYETSRFRVSNGRTLCKPCHESKPKRFKDVLSYLKYEVVEEAIIDMSESSEKGVKAEREAAALMRKKLGLKIYRDSRSGAGPANRSDLVDYFRQGRLACEVKDHKTVAIKQWFRQADAAASSGQMPTVVFRADNELLATVRFTDLLDLLREIQDGDNQIEELRTTAVTVRSENIPGLPEKVAQKVRQAGPTCRYGHLSDSFGKCLMKGCPGSAGYRVKKKRDA